MLNRIRKGSGGWLAKILLGMLILSFGVWGIGDIFRGGGNAVIAEVGNVRIGTDDYSRAYQAELREQSLRFGGTIDAATARRIGLPQRALQQLLFDALLGQAASKYGLAVSDNAVARVVRDDPAFQSGGRFDRALLQRVLRRNGVKEEDYLRTVRQDIARDELVQSLLAGRAAPDGFVDPIYRYRRETRIAQVFEISAASFRNVGVPDDAALRRYHEDNAARYTAPEYREVTYLNLTAEQVLDQIEISEEELLDEYDSRLDEFTRPEQREVEQLLYFDESSAVAARARALAGESLRQVSAATNPVNGTAISMGELRLGDLPEALDQAVFALEVGGLSEPIESDLGWHVFRVVRVIPAGVTGLDEVRDALRQSLAITYAADELYDLSNRLEDELAGGSDLENAALRLGIPVRSLAGIDGQGRDRSGTLVTELPQPREFVNSVFAADVGLESSPQDTDDGGYYMIRVDSVEPPTLRPLVEIRQQVIADWQAEERRRRAEKAAQDAIEAAKGGRSMAALAREHNASVRTTEPLPRTGASDPAASIHLVANLFSASVGDIVSGPLPGGDGFAVARLESIVEARPAENAVAAAQLRELLANAVLADVLLQYQVALQNEVGVEVNQSVVDALFLNDGFVGGGGGGGGHDPSDGHTHGGGGGHRAM